MVFPSAISSMLRLQALLLVLFAWPLEAVILESGDNDLTTSAPAGEDGERDDIFNSVAQVVTAGGVGGFGSAVHLRGKYLLTAMHVNVFGGGYVTFDGLTLHQVDAAFGKVQIGTADLALIKLVNDPGLNEVRLFDAAVGDVPYTDPETELTVYTNATIVGWGLGRDPGDPSGPTWNWGPASTMDKRWGLNRLEGTATATEGYNYEALVTTLETASGGLGVYEAAVANYDSGCGLFVKHNGEWKLAGIASSVETAGSSTFNDSTGDANFFVRINQVASAIETAIPDTDTYSGWKTDHSLSGADAQDSADTDGDGIPQLLEYALGGDPNGKDRSILPSKRVFDDGGTKYLELSVTRPIGLQGVSYVPQTTTDLTTWPLDSTGIANPSPAATDNNDGTETLIYRRALEVSGAARAFMRLKVESN